MVNAEVKICLIKIVQIESLRNKINHVRINSNHKDMNITKRKIN